MHRGAAALHRGATTPLDPVILAIDVRPVRYKRILGKMLEAERK
jgi:hypothetical protein